MAADAADKNCNAIIYEQRAQFDSLHWRVHDEIILYNMRMPMQIFTDVRYFRSQTRLGQCLFSTAHVWLIDMS